MQRRTSKDIGDSKSPKHFSSPHKDMVYMCVTWVVCVIRVRTYVCHVYMYVYMCGCSLSMVVYAQTDAGVKMRNRELNRSINRPYSFLKALNDNVSSTCIFTQYMYIRNVTISVQLSYIHALFVSQLLIVYCFELNIRKSQLHRLSLKMDICQSCLKKCLPQNQLIDF